MDTHEQMESGMTPDLDRLRIEFGRLSLELWDRLVQAEQENLPLDERLAGAQRAMELIGKNMKLLQRMRGFVGFGFRAQLGGAKAVREQVKGLENAVGTILRNAKDATGRQTGELLRGLRQLEKSTTKLQSLSL